MLSSLIFSGSTVVLVKVAKRFTHFGQRWKPSTLKLDDQSHSPQNGHERRHCYVLAPLQPIENVAAAPGVARNFSRLHASALARLFDGVTQIGSESNDVRHTGHISLSRHICPSCWAFPLGFLAKIARQGRSAFESLVHRSGFPSAPAHMPGPRSAGRPARSLRPGRSERSPRAASPPHPPAIAQHCPPCPPASAVPLPPPPPPPRTQTPPHRSGQGRPPRCPGLCVPLQLDPATQASFLAQSSMPVSAPRAGQKRA